MKGIVSLAKKDNAYWDWVKEGGQHSMLVSLDRTYLQKGIGDLTKSPIRNLIKNPIEALRLLSMLGEAGTRMGEFKKGIKKGVTPTEAAFASREVILDFARIGAKTRAVNQLIAFWNANVQGTDKLVRSFKDNPVNTTIKIAAGITLPSVLLTIVNHKDPRWKEIPQWQKDLFWIVMTEDHIWRIPKPFELGIIFGTVPERIVGRILDDDPEAFDGVLEAIGRGAAPGIVPTFALPIMENWANKSLFLDRPIVPADKEDVLPEYQYKPYTTEIAKTMGKLLGELPPLKKSPHIAPARIENLIRGWSGGLGMHIVNIADVALRKTNIVPDTIKPAKVLSDIPFIKAFTVRHPSAQAESINKFYENYKESKVILNTVRELDQELKFEEGLSLLTDKENLDLRLEGVYQGLRNAHQTINLIYVNPYMLSDEKRQLIDATYYHMIQMANEGNMFVKEIKKALQESKKEE